MLTFGKGLLAAVLSLTLTGGRVGPCAGWEPTPEARVTCCSEPGNCPMHKSDSPHSGTHSGVTQAQADSCCAISEGDDSRPSAPAFALSMSVALVSSPIPVVVPAALVHSDAWRTPVPLPGSQVPKHLFLSVFLV